ncbi:MAG: RidA family protein [Candidatus Eremiobacteraeota bacterium]|nr:RidA family protein [Candidatus Eremiobacteraeota bacterium]
MIGERIYSNSPYEEKAGYARAAVVGDWIFVSGTTGADPETNIFPEDVETQCENCFRKIALALEQAGATLDDLVRVLIFVTSRGEFDRILPIVRKHCYSARPANTTVIAQLIAPHMRVEIEVMVKKSDVHQ